MQGIDLFSGAGGMSIGAMQCGIQIRHAVEIDLNAAKTFKENHPHVELLQRDIRKVTRRDFFSLNKNEPIILFGGPPCQGFSTSNQKNRDAENKNNWLFKEYLRLVRSIRPEWVVFENVKGLIETENGYFLNAVLDGFRKSGYKVSHFILNSEDFGVPQRRNRLFIIGSLEGKNVDLPDRIGRSITVEEAIGDLPSLCNGNLNDVLAYKSEAKSEYARMLRGSMSLCSNNLVTRNASHIIDRYTHIPQGGNWEDIPPSLMENYSDASRCHTGIYRRLKSDEPSVVIGNFRKNMLIHPWENRGLSVREAARLQSFPDSFTFRGSIGFQQQQVGNAVPPLLAKAIFKKILES